MSQTVTRTQRHKTKSQKNKPVLMAGFLIGQFCCVVLNTLHIAFIALRMALLSQRASPSALGQGNTQAEGENSVENARDGDGQDQVEPPVEPAQQPHHEG